MPRLEGLATLCWVRVSVIQPNTLLSWTQMLALVGLWQSLGCA